MKKTLLLACLACLGTVMAQDNYSLWTNYKNINLNTTSGGANVTNTVTNFPVLVRLTSVNADVFTQAANGGADIRFAKLNGVHLPYQIERWDAANQAAEVWVLMDSVLGNSSTQSIRMYWGKAGAVDSSSGNTVFSPSNGYVGVWHLGDASGTSPRPNALTGGFSATPVNFPGNYTPVTGMIGLADSLTGGLGGGLYPTPSGTTPRYLRLDSGTATSLHDFTNGTFTYSIWISPDSLTSGGRLLELVGTLPNIARIWLGWSGTSLTFRFANAAAASQILTTSGTTFPLNTWQHITAVISRNGTTGDTSRIYLNGVQIAQGIFSGSTNQLPATSRTYFFLGQDYESTADHAFAGKMDEPELSNVVRSPDWIRLSYQNQQATQTLLALGSSQVQVQLPGAPTGVTGIPGNSQVSVTWVAPSSTGGGAITAYAVTAVQDTSKHCATSGALSCTVTGLTNGTSYTFTVTAANSAGTGAASAATAAIIPLTIPGAPTSVLDSAGNAQVKVSWTAPASNGGSAITGYSVTSVQDTGRHCTTTGSFTCTVTGLTNGTAYSFTVTATNAAGTGPASLASALVTPTAPPGVPNPPTGASATAGNGSASVTWVAAVTNGSAVTGYTVTSSPDGKICSTTGVLTCVDTALTNGVAYTFTVVATSSAGSSAASAPTIAVTPVGVPGAPTGVTAAAGNAQAVVSWSVPLSNGGAAISAYKAMAVSDTTKSCTTTGSLTCIVTGLTNGIAYAFVVKAVNSVGAGAASTASVAVTPATVPNAPVIASVVGASGQVTVTWTAPTSNGGATITGYKAMAVSDTTKSCSTTGTLTCIVTGLTNTTAYTFVVKAINSLGTGAASPASNSVTGIFIRQNMDIRLMGNSMGLRLPEFSGAARVSLLDIRGRIIWNKTVGEGTREVTLSAPGSSIISGIYIVRLSVQGPDRRIKTIAESKILLSR